MYKKGGSCTMKNQFIAFLASYKIFFRFRSMLPYNMEEFLEEIKPERWIIDAFFWDGTGEGHEFWKNININWQNEIKNEKI